MTKADHRRKRVFDLFFAALGLLLFWWLILLGFLLATLDTRANGFFTQSRVGRFGIPFKVLKLRTMRERPGHSTTVTTRTDPRITMLGAFLRRSKIDELPQLVNVLLGQMSFVGPRPDVPGFTDLLQGDDRLVLSVRPGITGPATLRFRDEEKILSEQADPESYNRNVIFPEKVMINKQYISDYSFKKDLSIIFHTLRG